LSPFIPLIFMGEDYGETAPFPYFISHSDAELIEAVRRGRRAEFAAFQWQGEIPDPQAEATFLQAQLRHESRHSEHHRVLYAFYKELFGLRKTIPALASLNKEAMTVRSYDNEQVLFVQRSGEDGQAIVIESFGRSEACVSLPIPAGHWRKILDSTDKKWQGGGSSTPNDLHSEGAITLSLKPRSAVVFTDIE
jgi:maltooligosyltrehalose trehalohydrolase